MVITTCPSRETLLRYSVGLLANDESDELAEHLDDCPDCQATIVTLEDADDTLVGRLRTPPSSESCLGEPEFQAACAQALAIPAAELSDPSSIGPRKADPLMPEKLGEYQLLEELGHGGMGRVYKALHTKLDRIVAVKVLPRGRMGDVQAITRFDREMKAVGRLAHPNIVQAFDAREIDGTPVLIMEFVDGLDLADIVHRIGPLPVAEACELVRQTAVALQCAHEHGLVHRDIKPSNIMLARAGEVKLLDLGLARFYESGRPRSSCGAGVSPVQCSRDGRTTSPEGVLGQPQRGLSPLSEPNDDMTASGQAMGTADYMAPEQASDSRTVDIRADIYSLGCTLYKLLSGRAPFGGPGHRGTLDKMNAHVHKPVPPVRQFAPEVPKELAAVLERMLAKNPDDRYATPAEVATAIEPFCRSASPLSLWERVRVRAEQAASGEQSADASSPLATVPVRRRPTLLWIALGAAFLGAMAAAYFAGVLVTIRKDGQTYQVEGPPGSRTVVDESGNATVELPGMSEKGAAAASTMAARREEAEAQRRAAESQLKAVEKELQRLVTDSKVSGKAKADMEAALKAYEDALNSYLQARRVAETRLLVAYKITKADPQEVLKLLQAFFGNSPDVRLTLDVNNQCLVVLAAPSEHERIRNALTVIMQVPAEKGASPVNVKTTKTLATIRFDFRFAPWKDVLEWFARQANLSLMMDSLPHGTFSYTDPRLFTPVEGIDLLNSVLVTKGYTLVRREKMLMLVNLEDFTHGSLPLTPLEGLDNMGEFEFVSVTFTLAKLSPEEAEPEVKKLLGPHGSVGSLPKSRQLVVTDMASRVRSIRELLKRLESPEGEADKGPFGTGAGAAGNASKWRRPPPQGETKGDSSSAGSGYVEFDGFTEASQNVRISPRVAGSVTKIEFHDGEQVKKGQLLFELDAEPYQAAVSKAQAELARTEAELAGAEKDFEWAKLRHSSGRIPEEDFNKATTRLATARPAVDAAKAAMDAAKANLAATRITSPLDGRAGKANCSVGESVQAGTALTTIVNDDPIYVRFLVDDKSYRQLIEQWPKGDGAARLQEQRIPIRVKLPNEEDFSHEGVIDFVDTETQAGGRIEFRAVLANHERTIRPGVLTRVRIMLAPSTATAQPATPSGGRPGTKLLYFYTDWDRISHEMTAVLDELAREGCAVQRVNADKEPDLAKKYHIDAVPSLVILEGETDVLRIRGRVEQVEALKALLEGRITPEGLKAALQNVKPRAVNPGAEFKAIEGKWKVVAVEKGRAADSTWPLLGMQTLDLREGDHWRFYANCLHVVNFRTGNEWSLLYQFDPAPSPKTIELRVQDGTEKGQLAALGVYEVQGNQLKVCLVRYVPSLQPEQRPTRVGVEPGSADVLLTLAHDQPSADEQAISGEWKIVSESEDGKVRSERLNHRFTFDEDTGNRYVVTAQTATSTPPATGQSQWGFYTLDPSKQPKGVTLHSKEMVPVATPDPYFGQTTYSMGNLKTEKLLGIYKFEAGRELALSKKREAERLTIAYRKNAPAPEKFESPAGSGVTVLVLQRVTAADASRAKDVEAVKNQIALLTTSLDIYHLDIGGYPTTAQGLQALSARPADLKQPGRWSGPYLRDPLPLDAWGRPYQYASPGIHNPQGFDLWAISLDGLEIGNWNRTPAAAQPSTSSGARPGTKLLYFYADWNPISREMMPVIDALVGEGYTVQRVNADQEPELAKKFHVDAVPSHVILEGETEVSRIRGRFTLEELKAVIQHSKPRGIDPTTELKALEGHWKVLRVEKGKDADDAFAKLLGDDREKLHLPPDVKIGDDPTSVVRIDFDQVAMTLFTEKYRLRRFAYQVDPTASPPAIDFLEVNFDSHPKGLAALGVYQIVGDQMRICLRPYVPTVKSDQRPKSFAVDSSSGDMLFVLGQRRVPSDDEKWVQGTWSVTSMIEDGKPVALDKSRPQTCNFRYDVVILRAASGDPRDIIAQYTLDKAEQPKKITILAHQFVDFYEQGKPTARNDLFGIYKFDYMFEAHGTKMTIAYRAGGPAPTRFDSARGSGVTLLALERPEADDGSAVKKSTSIAPSQPAGARTDSTRPKAKPRAVSAAADLAGLTGKWKIVRMEKGELPTGILFDPQTVPYVEIGYGSLRITDLKTPRNTLSDSFRVDPTAIPKTIDLYRREPKEHVTYVGIYEIEGDRLKLCLTRNLSALQTDHRPKGFAIEPKSADALLVCERYRPPEDENALQAEWEVVSEIDDGKPIIKAPNRGKWLTFWHGNLGGNFQIEEGDHEGESKKRNRLSYGAYVLDALKQPKWTTFYMDRYEIRGEKKVTLTDSRQESFGIYKLDGDRLHIAYSKEGPRPEKFESAAGSGVTLLVLQKGKSTAGPSPE